jgi:peptidoglycan hydrolase-like protein with peptidoglycan-binding domain
MLFSFSHSKHSFKKYDDMCEVSDSQDCANNHNEILNLQIALNHDKNLNFDLKTDGKWGEETKAAVQKFQEYYKLTPAAGYVGSKTKKQLDEVFSILNS